MPTGEDVGWAPPEPTATDGKPDYLQATLVRRSEAEGRHAASRHLDRQARPGSVATADARDAGKYSAAAVAMATLCNSQIKSTLIFDVIQKRTCRRNKRNDIKD